MSIAEKFASMEYGPAPEDSKEAISWLELHERRFENVHRWRLEAAGCWRILRHITIPRMARSWLALPKGARRTSMRQ